jgi:hypothetical protein
VPLDTSQLFPAKWESVFYVVRRKGHRQGFLGQSLVNVAGRDYMERGALATFCVFEERERAEEYMYDFCSHPRVQEDPELW